MKFIMSAVMLLLFAMSFGQVKERLDLREDLKQRYLRLTQELRCLVCQNQDIANSNAPLAHDLRAKLRMMLKRGDSDQTIKSYMQKKYGDYILMKPAMYGWGWMLWLAPIVMLLVGFLIAYRVLKQPWRGTE